MTSVSDVHLFDWIRENAPFLGPLFLLFVGMMAGWIKVMVSRYPTRTEIHRELAAKVTECREEASRREAALRADADKREKAAQDNQRLIIHSIDSLRMELSARIDRVDDNNATAHSDIMSRIVKLCISHLKTSIVL